MINPTISADWNTTKPIAPFSCTPRVQEVHTKAEVVHLTPGLLGLGVLFNCHSWEMYCEICDRICENPPLGLGGEKFFNPLLPFSLSEDTTG